MLIQIKHKLVHEVDRMYVCDSIQAEAISQLTKKKTVDQNDVYALTALGHTVEDLDQVLSRMIE